MSTVARSLKGTLVGALSFVVQALQAIAVVPLMLQGWGASQYAVWLACQAALGMLLTLDTGHQTYVGNEMTKMLPVDREATRVVLGSALRFSLVLGAAEVALITSLIATGQVGTLLGVQKEMVAKQSLGAVLLLLVTSWVVVGSLGGVLARLFPPAGLFARGAVWGLLQKLLLAFVVTVAAFLKQSLLAAAVWTSLATTALGALFLAECHVVLSGLRPFTTLGSFVVGARNFARSLPLTGSTLVVQLQSNGLILLVSSLYGGPSLAAFATLRTLANTIVQATTTIFSPAVPELVRLRMTEQHAKLRTGLYGLAVLATLPAACGALLLAAIGGPLYGLWTRHKVPFDRPLFQILAAAAVWRIFGSPLVNHLLAMNRIRSIGLWAFAQTGTLFAAAAALAPFWAMPGVAGGVLAGEIVGSVILPVAWTYSDLPEPERPEFVREQLLAAATPMLVTFVLVASIRVSDHVRWGVDLIGAVLCVVLFVRQYRQIPVEMRNQAMVALRKLLKRGANRA